MLCDALLIQNGADYSFDDCDFQRQLIACTPLGWVGAFQVMAPAVVLLTSPDSSWITGETLYISGGYR